MPYYNRDPKRDHNSDNHQYAHHMKTKSLPATGRYREELCICLNLFPLGLGFWFLLGAVGPFTFCSQAPGVFSLGGFPLSARGHKLH